MSIGSLSSAEITILPLPTTQQQMIMVALCRKVSCNSASCCGNRGLTHKDNKDAVKEITLTAFAGCPITEELIDKLEQIRVSAGFTIRLENVYRAEDAERKGLYGSPTIHINQHEYQMNRRGAAGVYCRVFVTADGHSIMPDIEDILTRLNSGEETACNVKGGEVLAYPVLLVSEECVFTRPAKNFWSKVADELGVDLSVVMVEKERELAAKYNAFGYPCLICGPEIRYYGFHFSHEQGKKILQQNQ